MLIRVVIQKSLWNKGWIATLASLVRNDVKHESLAQGVIARKNDEAIQRKNYNLIF